MSDVAIADTSTPAVACEPKPGLAISIRYTTERCVATSVSSRDDAEWPPHPGRIFMAMAAAYFETDGSDEEKQAEINALNWLTQQSAPELRFTDCSHRSAFTCYVPVNDNPKPNKAMLQSAPGLPRSRQPRTFPTVIPHYCDDQTPHVQLVWPMESVPGEHLDALDRICRNVVRIGHSSSFVMSWAEATYREDDGWDKRLLPTESPGEFAFRLARDGELERLRQACRADDIDLFAELAETIDQSSGKQKTEAKQAFEAKFGEPYKKSVRPPEPLPPSLGYWQSYRNADAAKSDVHQNSYFETELLIFEKIDGPVLNVERTLNLTRTLRNTAMKGCPQQPPPAWLGGHDADGRPTEAPHAAFLALPFVGDRSERRERYADGHVMGLAIALPRDLSSAERGECLGPTIVDAKTGEPQEITLYAKGLPDVTFRLSTQPSPPKFLRNATWTQASTTWASATPVVLDKFPKCSKRDDRSGWFTEVRAIIALSCVRAGLPEPVEIDIDTTSWLTGVPRATQKTRRLQPPHEGRDRTSFGEGFPPLATRATRAEKPQVHVWLRFEQEVTGPVIIGSGRFAGYGLCRPVIGRK